MAQEEDWPGYGRSIRHHVHAIGVLSVNFNSLENELLGFLQLYDGAPDDVVSFLFEKMPTETRLEWLRRLVVARKLRPPHLMDCILAFAKAYQVCANNRNLIVHSRIDAHSDTDDTLMMSKRVRAHGAERHHDLSLKIIRRVADEVHFWNAFGHDVLFYALRRKRARQKRFSGPGLTLAGPTTLPEISSPPEDLAKPFQSGDKKRSRRPRSSRG